MNLIGISQKRKPSGERFFYSYTIPDSYMAKIKGALIGVMGSLIFLFQFRPLHLDRLH